VRVETSTAKKTRDPIVKKANHVVMGQLRKVRGRIRIVDCPIGASGGRAGRGGPPWALSALWSFNRADTLSEETGLLVLTAIRWIYGPVRGLGIHSTASMGRG